MRIIFAFFSILVLAIPAFSAQVELLQNPGFETGTLSPWTTSNWTVVTDSPHSGTYCAFDDGNYWIRQDFDPVAVADIISITVWYRQPEVAIFAVDLFYGPSDFDEDIEVLSSGNWQQFNVTDHLRVSGNLVAIRYWGYTTSPPDYSYLDDASIIYENHDTAIIGGSLGSIKALFN